MNSDMNGPITARLRTGVRRVTLLAAAALTAAGALTAAAAAEAAPRGTVVVMGDSFTSDTYAPAQPCGQSPTNWPSRFAAGSGKRLVNVSCLGAELDGPQNVYDQAQRARRAGGFTAATETVLVQLGFNDYNGGLDLYSRCLSRGCPGGESQFGRFTAARFAQRLGPLVTYVKHYSPNARIALVGYPELYAAGDRELCFGLAGARVRVPNSSAAPAFSRRLQSAQRGAAELLKIDFVDLAAATRGHGMCAPDPWIQGVLSPVPGHADDVLMVGHPTDRGNLAAARAVRAALRG